MSKDNYEIGKGKPPKNKQFGEPEGNPINKDGRPKGTRKKVQEFARFSEEALWSCLIDSAEKPVTVKQNGEDMTIPLFMAITQGMANDAAKGDRFARRDYLKYLEKATKGSDALHLDMQQLAADYREHRLRTIGKEGTLDHMNYKYRWFMYKFHMRKTEKDSVWVYEDDEPIIVKDWELFREKYEYLQANPSETIEWPLKYPSDDDQLRKNPHTDLTMP